MEYDPHRKRGKLPLWRRQHSFGLKRLEPRLISERIGIFFAEERERRNVGRGTGKLVIRLSGLSVEKGQTLMRGKATQVGQSGMQGPIRIAVPQETNETRVPKQII